MPTNKAAAAASQSADYSAQATAIKTGIADNAASMSLAELQSYALNCMSLDFLSCRLSDYAGRYQKTKSFGPAGYVCHSDTWDLISLHLTASGIAFLVSIPAIPTLADGATVTAQLEHGTDGVSFSSVGSAVTATGASGTGSPAVTTQFNAPASLHQYSRFVVTTSSDASGIQPATVTLTILF